MVKQQMDFLARWRLEQAQVQTSKRPIYLTPRYIALFAGTVLLLVALAAAPWLYAYKLDQDLVDINDKIAEFGPVQQKLGALESVSKQLNDGYQVLAAYNQNKVNPNEIIVKLMPHLPQGTTIASLAVKEDKSFQISMNLSTPVDMLRLWVKFRESGMFQAVDFNTVSFQDKPQTITMTLKFAEAK